MAWKSAWDAPRKQLLTFLKPKLKPLFWIPFWPSESGMDGIRVLKRHFSQYARADSQVDSQADSREDSRAEILAMWIEPPIFIHLNPGGRARSTWRCGTSTSPRPPSSWTPAARTQTSGTSTVWLRCTGWQFNGNFLGLSSGLKNGLRFHFDFVTCLN